MQRLFIVYALMFAVASVAHGSLRDWCLIVAGGVFALTLPLLGGGIARAVAVWPRAVPRLLAVDVAFVIITSILSFLLSTHFLAWVATIALVGCAASLVVVAIAVAGWLQSLGGNAGPTF